MAWGFGNSGSAGGGFNRNDAILRVQAPAHSVVTIAKGTYHKTDYGHQNEDDHSKYDYHFIIHQSQFDSENQWTVTGTLEGDTAISHVIIDRPDEFDVKLYYEYVIISAHDSSEIANFTRIATGSARLFEVDANNRWGCANQSNSSVGGFLSYIGLDISSFNTMTLTYTSMNACSYHSGQFGIYVMTGEYTPLIVTGTGYNVYTGCPTEYLATDRFVDDTASGARAGTFTIDLTPYSGFYYIGFSHGRGSVGAGARPWGGYVTDWRLD